MSTPSLPAAENSGQCAATGSSTESAPAVVQHQHTQRGDHLGGRPDIDDRVVMPRFRFGDVSMPAPQIDYQLTPVDHSTRSTQVTFIKIGRESLPHAFKSKLTSPMYLSHSRTVSASARVWWGVDVSGTLVGCVTGSPGEIESGWRARAVENPTDGRVADEQLIAGQQDRSSDHADPKELE